MEQSTGCKIKQLEVDTGSRFLVVINPAFASELGSYVQRSCKGKRQ
jgi:hypothetical protein